MFIDRWAVEGERVRTQHSLLNLVVHESSSGVRHLGRLDSEIPAGGYRRQHFPGFMKEDKLWPSLMKHENYHRATLYRALITVSAIHLTRRSADEQIFGLKREVMDTQIRKFLKKS